MTAGESRRFDATPAAILDWAAGGSEVDSETASNVNLTPQKLRWYSAGVLYVAAATKLPKATAFVTKAFGATPDAILMFVGPGSGWDSASLKDAIVYGVSAMNPPSPTQLTHHKSVIPSGPVHAIYTAGSADLHVHGFLRDELFPLLAEATKGVVFEDDAIIHRAGASSPPQPPYVHFDMLRAACNALRETKEGSDDWSDL